MKQEPKVLQTKTQHHTKKNSGPWQVTVMVCHKMSGQLSLKEKKNINSVINKLTWNLAEWQKKSEMSSHSSFWHVFHFCDEMSSPILKAKERHVWGVSDLPIAQSSACSTQKSLNSRTDSAQQVTRVCSLLPLQEYRFPTFNRMDVKSPITVQL